MTSHVFWHLVYRVPRGKLVLIICSSWQVQMFFLMHFDMHTSWFLDASSQICFSECFWSQVCLLPPYWSVCLCLMLPFFFVGFSYLNPVCPFSTTQVLTPFLLMVFWSLSSRACAWCVPVRPKAMFADHILLIAVWKNVLLIKTKHISSFYTWSTSYYCRVLRMKFFSVKCYMMLWYW